jgi:hypothetical protein
MSVSHPFATSPSQLPNDLSQATSVHVPPTHASEACGRSQVAPHAPQFASVVTSVSQPVVASPSQSASDAGQPSSTQTPALHLAPGVQTFPHVAQLAASPARFVSQPFAKRPSQLQSVASHAGSGQVPAMQGTPQGHALPQAPQCLLSSERLVSQPFAVTPSQLSKQPSHMTIVQLPVAHDSLAWARSHATPHAPQSVSVVSDVSHPLAVIPSQFPQPGTQGTISSHRPVRHDSSAFGASQIRPHQPQFHGVSMRVSQPSAA